MAKRIYDGESSRWGGFSSGYGCRGNNTETWKYRKHDMPLFDREDPHGWMVRVETNNFVSLDTVEKLGLHISDSRASDFL